MVDPSGMASTYNWENERYEDEDGNEVSWNSVQAEYGLGGNSDNNGNDGGCDNPPCDNELPATTLGGLLYGAWYAVEDGIANLTVGPIINNAIGASALRKLASKKGINLSSLSDQEIEDTFRTRWINGDPELVLNNLSYLGLLAEKGLDLISVAAVLYGGTGALIAKTPGGGSSFKKLADDYIKKNGIDAEALKADFMGPKSVSKYDLYKQNGTNEIWIFRKGGKGDGIPTGEYID